MYIYIYYIYYVHQTPYFKASFFNYIFIKNNNVKILNKVLSVGFQYNVTKNS